MMHILGLAAVNKGKCKQYAVKSVNGAEMHFI